MAKRQNVLEVEDLPPKPSKTYRKKERENITKLVGSWAKLSVKQIKELKLPGEIESELLKILPMKPDGSRKRQVNFVASLVFTAKKADFTQLAD